jgi:hypothetical protein
MFRATHQVYRTCFVILPHVGPETTGSFLFGGKAYSIIRIIGLYAVINDTIYAFKSDLSSYYREVRDSFFGEYDICLLYTCAGHMEFPCSCSVRGWPEPPGLLGYVSCSTVVTQYTH